MRSMRPSPASRVLSKLVKPAMALALVAAVPAVLPAPVARAEKFPEPSPYQISWEFKFQHGPPKRVVVRVPGTPNPVAYWYLTYTVTNPGDKPQKFVPTFDLLAEDGQVIHADQAIPPEVFQEIKHQEPNKLMVRSSDIIGMLNPGPDEAKDGVAIWPEPAPRMGTFHIFVGGLSGEFVEIKDKEGKPVINKDPKTGEQTKVVVRKTLELTYHLRGDEVRPGPDDEHEGDKDVEQWVMR
jgi:hypothetical protein